jgi:H+-transporting ATPase
MICFAFRVDPTNKRSEITYKVLSDGSVHRVTKGMSHAILDLCSRDKTNEQIRQLNADVDLFARRGLRALAVAVEDVIDEKAQGEGNGFKLVGLLPLHAPPYPDTKATIQSALNIGVKAKMITGDQLAIANEIGRRIGMGDYMFLSKTLKEGPPAESGYTDIDDLILHADGFAGVYPEHKYEIIEKLRSMGHMVVMIGDGTNDISALEAANIGVAAGNACDLTRACADIVLTKPDLSVIIEGNKSH